MKTWEYVVVSKSHHVVTTGFYRKRSGAANPVRPMEVVPLLLGSPSHSYPHRDFSSFTRDMIKLQCSAIPVQDSLCDLRVTETTTQNVNPLDAPCFQRWWFEESRIWSTSFVGCGILVVWCSLMCCLVGFGGWIPQNWHASLSLWRSPWSATERSWQKVLKSGWCSEVHLQVKHLRQWNESNLTTMSVLYRVRDTPLFSRVPAVASVRPSWGAFTHEGWGP